MSIRWSLLFFAFSLPFEEVDLGIFSGALSLPRIAGLFVLLSCLLHHRLTFSKPHPGFWCLGGYLAIHYFRGAFVYDNFFGGPYFLPFITLFQLFALAWLVARPLKDSKFAVQVLLAFSIASMLVAVGMILALPGFSQDLQTQGIERVSAAGNNPNVLGCLLAIAFVIVIGLLLGKGMLSKRGKLGLGFLGLLLPIGVLLTGSRGAILALIAGVAVYVAPIGRASVLRKISFVLCCLAGLIILLVRDPNFMARLSSTYYEGDFSGRDSILAMSFKMIQEKPLFGWGPVELAEQLGRALNFPGPRDTHNTFVYLLMEVGIIGTIPFVVGLLFCLIRLWRSRDNDWSMVCFAAFTALMVANLSGTWIHSKALWLLLAVSFSVARESRSVYSAVNPSIRNRYLLRYERRVGLR